MRSNMSTPPAPSKLSKLVPGCGIAFIVVVAAALIAVVVVAAYLLIRLVAENSTPAPTMAAQTPVKTHPTTTPVPDPAVTQQPRSGRSSRAFGINATQDQPWENSLGMKFVPVPETTVLFAIWDTRVQDFQQFVAETGYKVTGEMWSLGTSMVRNKERAKWNEPGFIQGPTHPVVGVNWVDAEAFCSWLTKREHANKVLSAELHYRLPTDTEWSVAVGLDHEDGTTPKEKSGKITGTYPWGTAWPPPRSAGNYAGKEAQNRVPFASDSVYEDNWIFTSPVGSFDANKYGLYDMGGNVWQWCKDSDDSAEDSSVLRGGSWDDTVDIGHQQLLSSYRGHVSIIGRFAGILPVGELGSAADNIGFRCVVAKEGLP
jgi:formylglycine-generating enzyme required for sulfatase activity